MQRLNGQQPHLNQQRFSQRSTEPLVSNHDGESPQNSTSEIRPIDTRGAASHLPNPSASSTSGYGQIFQPAPDLPATTQNFYTPAAFSKARLATDSDLQILINIGHILFTGIAEGEPWLEILQPDEEPGARNPLAKITLGVDHDGYRLRVLAGMEDFVMPSLQSGAAQDQARADFNQALEDARFPTIEAAIAFVQKWIRDLDLTCNLMVAADTVALGQQWAALQPGQEDIALVRDAMEDYSNLEANRLHEEFEDLDSMSVAPTTFPAIDWGDLFDEIPDNSAVDQDPDPNVPGPSTRSGATKTEDEKQAIRQRVFKDFVERNPLPEQQEIHEYLTVFAMLRDMRELSVKDLQALAGWSGVNIYRLLGRPFEIARPLNTREQALVRELRSGSIPPDRHDEIRRKFEVARQFAVNPGSWTLTENAAVRRRRVSELLQLWGPPRVVTIAKMSKALKINHRIFSYVMDEAAKKDYAKAPTNAALVSALGGIDTPGIDLTAYKKALFAQRNASERNGGASQAILQSLRQSADPALLRHRQTLAVIEQLRRSGDVPDSLLSKLLYPEKKSNSALSNFTAGVSSRRLTPSAEEAKKNTDPAWQIDRAVHRLKQILTKAERTDDDKKLLGDWINSALALIDYVKNQSRRKQPRHEVVATTAHAGVATQQSRSEDDDD